jgi:16S rRNA (guanine966-N2)-methyltransferase
VVDVVRIVGGEFRGRHLATPKTDEIRPTTDRVRESLFNILSHAYPESLEGTRVLDMFAGTGAVGIEALSRGCKQALFIEMGVEGRGLLRTNIETLGLTGRAKIFRRDATDMGQAGTQEPFHLAFADPPYGKGLGEKAIASAALGSWLVPGALVILEERSDVVPQLPTGFAFLEKRAFGETTMHFYRYAP